MSFFNDVATTKPGTGFMADGSPLIPWGTYVRLHPGAADSPFADGSGYAQIVGTDGIYTRYSVRMRMRDWGLVAWTADEEWVRPGEFDVVDSREATGEPQ